MHCIFGVQVIVYEQFPEHEIRIFESFTITTTAISTSPVPKLTFNSTTNSSHLDHTMNGQVSLFHTQSSGLSHDEQILRTILLNELQSSECNTPTATANTSQQESNAGESNIYNGPATYPLPAATNNAQQRKRTYRRAGEILERATRHDDKELAIMDGVLRTSIQQALRNAAKAIAVQHNWLVQAILRAVDQMRYDNGILNKHHFRHLSRQVNRGGPGPRVGPILMSPQEWSDMEDSRKAEVRRLQRIFKDSKAAFEAEELRRAKQQEEFQQAAVKAMRQRQEEVLRAEEAQQAEADQRQQTEAQRLTESCHRIDDIKISLASGGKDLLDCAAAIGDKELAAVARVSLRALRGRLLKAIEEVSRETDRSEDDIATEFDKRRCANGLKLRTGNKGDGIPLAAKSRLRSQTRKIKDLREAYHLRESQQSTDTTLNSPRTAIDVGSNDGRASAVQHDRTEQWVLQTPVLRGGSIV